MPSLRDAACVEGRLGEQGLGENQGVLALEVEEAREPGEVAVA